VLVLIVPDYNSHPQCANFQLVVSSFGLLLHSLSHYYAELESVSDFMVGYAKGTIISIVPSRLSPSLNLPQR
jgi:hypothetical protein